MRMIEDVEEFRPELQRGVLPEAAHAGGLDERGIEIELSGAFDDPNARIAEAGSIANRSHRPKAAALS